MTTNSLESTAVSPADEVVLEEEVVSTTDDPAVFSDHVSKIYYIKCLKAIICKINNHGLF